MYKNQYWKCRSNLSMIQTALMNYHEDYGSYPPIRTVDVNGNRFQSWRVLILPYLNQKDLYDQIRQDEPGNHRFNKKSVLTLRYRNQIIIYYFERFFCDTELKKYKNKGLDSHSAVVKDGSLFSGAQVVKEKDKNENGLKNAKNKRLFQEKRSILLVEVKEPFCWMDPCADLTLQDVLTGINRSEKGIGSRHKNGTFVLQSDFPLFIKNDISPELLKKILDGDGAPLTPILPLFAERMRTITDDQWRSPFA